MATGAMLADFTRSRGSLNSIDTIVVVFDPTRLFKFCAFFTFKKKSAKFFTKGFKKFSCNQIIRIPKRHIIFMGQITNEQRLFNACSAKRTIHGEFLLFFVVKLGIWVKINLVPARTILNKSSLPERFYQPLTRDLTSRAQILILAIPRHMFRTTINMMLKRYNRLIPRHNFF